VSANGDYSVVSHTDIEAAWNTATLGWTASSNSTDDPNVEFHGPSITKKGLSRDDSDGKNAVFMQSKAADDDSLAKFSCSLDEDDNGNCVWDDCDIRVYSSGDYDGDDRSEPTPLTSLENAADNYVSLAFVFQHEIGHVLGINDQDPSTYPDTAMQDAFWSPTDAWGYYDPSAEDIAAAIWIYDKRK